MSITDKLKKLFSTNIVIVPNNAGGIKIADTNHVQSLAVNTLMNRYTGLYSSMSAGTGKAQQVFMATQRMSLFSDYESMDTDAILSSALDIYADESTLRSEYGNILTIHSENDQVRDVLNNLFYDILNIEFNLWPWVRNMCKYGDHFLYLDISDKLGIMNVIPISVYDLARIEGEDKNDSNSVYFEFISGDKRHTNMMYSQNRFEEYEIAHFRLIGDSNYLPYGKSMIEGARKIWKQITLMEDAMLIHRIMRAPERRIFKIDIGNIAPNQVETYMKRIIDKMKKTPIMNKNGEYNLKFNMQNLTEDFFLPVRGGDSGTEIDTLPGMTYDTIDDIEYLRNKMMAALKIPKAFLGYEEGLGSKSTLAQEDVRFSRTIERIQRTMISELTKIAMIHLMAQGFKRSDLLNFDLELTNPSIIYEQEQLEKWDSRLSMANTALDNNILGSDWIYNNIFKFTKEEKEKIRLDILADKKRKFRYEQIENEGNDPAKSNEIVGTPGSSQSEINNNKFDLPKGGSPKGGWEGAGRPKEVTHYDKDDSAMGRDPLGKHDIKKSASGNKKYGKALALSHYDSLKKTKLFTDVDKEILNETEDVSTEYIKEINS